MERACVVCSSNQVKCHRLLMGSCHFPSRRLAQTNQKRNKETCSVYLLMKSCAPGLYYKRTCRTPQSSYVSILAYISVCYVNVTDAQAVEETWHSTRRESIYGQPATASYISGLLGRRDVIHLYYMLDLIYVPLMHRLEPMKMTGIRHDWRPDVLASIAGSHNYPSSNTKCYIRVDTNSFGVFLTAAGAGAAPHSKWKWAIFAFGRIWALERY